MAPLAWRKHVRLRGQEQQIKLGTMTLLTLMFYPWVDIAELCDDSNKAKGFSLIGASWGLGMIVGPMFGGFLSHKGEGIFFETYPYALPCFVSAAICIAGFVISVCWLRETLPPPVTVGTKDLELEELGQEEPAAASTPRKAATTASLWSRIVGLMRTRRVITPVVM